MKKNYIFTLLLTICTFSISLGQDLLITGIFDGPNTGGTPKGIELYVVNNITDLSVYGVGSANNGGGTDGEEFTFPATAATAGSFIYLASETTEFNNFFGFMPTYTSGSMIINGDDAVELFKDGAVVDLYGDQDTDGNGEAWDYLNGWGSRNSATTSNGAFSSADWAYSGINQLEGGSTNATTTSPFPIGTYTPATASVKDNVIAGFATYPNPITDKKFTISSNSSDTKQATIFNVLGKKVFSTSFSGTNKNINVSNINAGVYILKVTETGKTTTKKLVIR